VLTRVFKLRKKIEQFLIHGGSGVTEHFENEFVISLAYLANIFSHLNNFNTSIQGTAMNMIVAGERISPFTTELSICISRIGSGNNTNFSQLEVSNRKIPLPLSIVIEIKIKFAGVTADLPRILSTRRGFCFTGLDLEPSPDVFTRGALR